MQRSSSLFPTQAMKKRACIVAGSALMLGLGLAPAQAVGEGPNNNQNGTTNTSILHTYDSMVAELKTQDAKQAALDLEVIGQSVKGRDLYLAKYISDPSNPTILFLTQ